MREIRVDPTTGQRVIVAPERLQRPRPGEQSGLPKVDREDCPFCPGHEGDTAATIASVGEPWTARAFPNRFPALVVEHDPAGAHEVIVESREHDKPLWEAPVQRLADALRLARDRMRDLSGDSRFNYMAWFRNHGVRAGSSQPHPHSQLVALPYVPALVDEMVRRCVPNGMDAVLTSAREAERVVASYGAVTAVCPHAPRYPFEVWLVPGPGETDCRDADDQRILELAHTMRQALADQARELAPLAYCAVLYTRPLRSSDTPGFRWHVRLQPRPEIHSGFASATGDTINGVPPELAARLLRGGRSV